MRRRERRLRGKRLCELRRQHAHGGASCGGGLRRKLGRELQWRATLWQRAEAG